MQTLVALFPTKLDFSSELGEKSWPTTSRGVLCEVFVEKIMWIVEMAELERMLRSGDEAIALAALDAGVALGTGYPGTPSTEILEYFSEIGGRAQWSPNEKVALEV